MTKIKKHDFVEIEYTGRIKEDDIIFDTTDAQIAKENSIYTENRAYGAVVICVGESNIIKGLDNALEGKETEKSYTIELPPEQGFGKKSAKLIQLISTTKFLQQDIKPVPGLQVNIDGLLGMVKTVSGGRTLVDFNHPLASKTLIYNLKINKIVTDDKEKLKNYLKLQLNTKDITIDLKEGNAAIKIKKDIPKEIKENLNKKITEIIPSIKKVEFIITKEQKK